MAALAFFKKKKPDDSAEPKANGDSGATPPPSVPAGKAPPVSDGKGKPAEKPKGGKANFLRDERKARKFFEHAETVAETRNYDYAIECYINGLRHDPDNMPRHEQLREISLKRKVSGGKPAGFAERLKNKGKTKVDKLLHAELLWSKDPLNLARMLEVMERGVEADSAGEDLHMGELVYWIGQMVLEKNETEKQPKKPDMLKLKSMFEAIGAWDEAVKATRIILENIDPNDASLEEELKDLEAERAMAKGNYSADARNAVRDKDFQDALQQEDQLSKTEDTADKIIARKRAEYEEDPQDEDRKLKLIKALAEKNSDESENEAIQLLTELQEQTGQYRHKVAVGDIKFKQMGRHLRDLKDKLKATPDDAAAKEAYTQLAKKRLDFELVEYAERAKNYPTDMKWRYELGRRLFQVKRFDDAMTNFQMAKADPKFRAAALNYLGQCYLSQKWNDEAVDTLREGVEAVPDAANPLSLEMRWHLTTALVQSGVEHNNLDLVREALKVASQILQTDVNYRDIKKRMEQIRTVQKKMQDKNSKDNDK